MAVPLVNRCSGVRRWLYFAWGPSCCEDYCTSVDNCLLAKAIGGRLVGPTSE
ncbi:hypothetical protein IF1G_11372 [Cordyceps javanica]|uniref:Uncharacterized protein n=1 Tax=Cordyceps javanica TaxID=43265 RepID=A0A545UKH5_9HYPO|nr:hypothetical protein IF1G_11372 [Cordyceps javanica]